MNHSKKHKLFLFVLLATILIISFCFFINMDFTQLFESKVIPLEWEGVTFMLLYIICSLSFVPRSAMSIVGGFVFGVTLGAVYSLVSSYIAASLSFLIARYLGKEWIDKNTSGKFLKVKEGVESLGWKFVAMSRLLPVLPFSMLNYAFGLTRVSFSVYIVNTMIFIIPICLMYSMIGETGQHIFSLVFS